MEDRKKRFYRGSCPVHDWEGKERESKAEAKMDLEGHKKTYEEETHRGSRVISYER